MNSNTKPPKETAAEENLIATAQAILLPKGLYLFQVRSPNAKAPPGKTRLSLPAVQVAPAPNVPSDAVDFLSGPSSFGGWLSNHGDAVVMRIRANAAPILMTSIRGAADKPLSIDVERLDDRATAALHHGPLEKVSADAGKTAPEPAEPREGIKLQIIAHIRNRGDVTYTDEAWAGRAGAGFGVEAFSVSPLEALTPGDIEYKGLTASGYETPWMSNGAFCGTKGMATPLLGFAVRLKRSGDPRPYECEYRGYFRSGRVVGPLKNGAPCRSTQPNDPLEGLQIFIKDQKAAAKSAKGRADEADTKAQGGPRFGAFREDERPGAKGQVARDAAKGRRPAKAEE